MNVSACIHNNRRVGLETELGNLHNHRRTTAPDSHGGFFAPKFPRVARLRGRPACPSRKAKMGRPNLWWGFQPPESVRLETVRAPATFSTGARDMTTLVTIHDGTPTTTSLAIAEGTKSQHKNVLELVRKYQPDLEEFGKLAFETRKGNGNSAFQTRNSKSNAGRPTEIARLNERQSTLLMTYMRNTAIVREFKKRLVKGFYEMAEKQAKTTPSPKPTKKTMNDQSHRQRVKISGEYVLVDPEQLMQDISDVLGSLSVGSYQRIQHLRIKR